jgi:hypothetical protein
MDLEKERRYWESRPDRTLVLLVVVDEYEGPDYPPLDGIGAQAARFAGQLIRYGVQAGNILVLSSEQARGVFPAGVLWLGPMDQRHLKKAIQEQIMSREAELLWVHWIGHGVYDDDGMKLLTADAERQLVEVVDVAKLRTLLRRDPAVNAKKQLLTIDACQQEAQGTQTITLRNPAATLDGSASQIDIRGSRPGGIANLETRGGLFTEALMFAIDEVGEPGRWPPDVTRLADAISAWLREALEGEFEGIQWATDTPWEGFRRREDELRTRDQRRELVAWAVPGGWSPGAYDAGFGSASQLSLEMRLVANRCRSVLAVAEPADTDLAADLNRAEEALDDLQLSEVPPRRWVTVALERYGDRSADPAIGQHVLEPERWRQDLVVGLVLRLDVDGAGDLTAGQHIRREQLRTSLLRIAQECPDASIAVAVRARRPIDALLAARQLAGELAAVPPPVDQRGLVTRARPGTLGGSVGKLTGLAGTGLLPVVLERLRFQAQQRGLPFPFGVGATDAGSGASEPTAADPTAVARDIVAELEAPGFAWPGHPEDRDPDEAFLCAVRDLAPELYPHLLQAYAADRSSPGWGVSLAVAAQFDEDLTTWLGATSDSRRPDPRDSGRWLPATYGWAPVEALLLALAQREPPVPSGELPPAVRPRFAEALELLRSAAPDGRGFRLSGAAQDVVAILFVTSQDPAGLLGPEPDVYAEQTWYAVRAAARTSEGARAMLRWVADAPDPAFARAVVGLAPLPEDTEAQRRERAAELHRLLHDVPGG